MTITELPGLPESALPDAVAAQLPQSTPAAPWSCRVRAVLWVQRAPSVLPASSPFAARARPWVLGGFVDYLDSPVGSYREVLVGQLLSGSVLPVVHIPFIAVDSLPSVHGGRALWRLPKAVASFRGDIGTGAARAEGDRWSVSVRAAPGGARFPVVGPLRNDQGAGVSTSHLRGSARLARVRVEASGVTLDGWLGTGRHLGLVARGRLVVGAPAPGAPAT